MDADAVPWVVDAAKQAQLDHRGYLHVPSAIGPDLLAHLRAAAERMEETALAAHRSGTAMAHAAVFDSASGPVVERVDKMLEVEPHAALDLLSSSPMLAIARDLCGRDVVPIEMDLLLKRQHPNGYVIWHQGAQHSRRWPYLNVGIYLDDAPIDDGCVRFVPGTHREQHDVGGLSGKHGWDIPGSVDVPAAAGDIVVQDMMVLHCSPPKRSIGRRRTIYVELRPHRAIVEDRSQTSIWAELRRRWMAMVVRRASPEDWPAEWHTDLPEVGTIEDEVQAIARVWEPPLPSHYGIHSGDHPDYPVPADLR